MYTLDDLSVRLLSELREIAENLGIKNAKKTAKKDLIYEILDKQATLPDSEIQKIKKEEKRPESKPESKPESRPARPANKKRENVKRENVKENKPTEKAEAKSPEDLLKSLDIEIETESSGEAPAAKGGETKEQKPREGKSEGHNKPNKRRENERSEDRPKSDDRESKERKEQRNEHKGRKAQFNEDIKDFDGVIENEGVLEIMQDGYGFLRSSDYHYLAVRMISTYHRLRSNCLV